LRRKPLLLIVTIVITIVAFSIAIPTFFLNIGGNYKRVRGIDPRDLNPDFLVQEFAFQPSLDLSGGQIATLNVDLSALPASQRLERFSIIRNIIFNRLSNIGFSDFEIDDLYNEDAEEYKLLLRFPGEIDVSLLQLMLQRGEVSVWVSDPSTEVSEDDARNPFAGRIQTGIRNEDFAYVSVVSDSRIYLFDPAQPNNFGLRLGFRDESAQKLANAVFSSQQVPMLFAIDGQPIAIQAPGVNINTTNIGKELLLATLGADTRFYNSVIGSVMVSPTLDFPVSITQIGKVGPNLDDSTLTFIKVASLVSFVLGQGVIIFYFRRYAKALVITNVIFVCWSIALMKMFGLTLSFSTYVGYMLSLAIFIAFNVLLVYRTRIKQTGGITREELQEAYAATSSDYILFLIAVIAMALIIQYFRMINVNQFTQSLGFGLVTGLMVLLIAVKAIFPFLFLRTKSK